VEMVAQDRLLQPEQKRMRVITQDDGDTLRIVIFLRVWGLAQPPVIDVLRPWDTIAEVTLQPTASSRLKCLALTPIGPKFYWRPLKRAKGLPSGRVSSGNEGGTLLPITAGTDSLSTPGRICLIDGRATPPS
jgi:hypothetical protein